MAICKIISHAGKGRCLNIGDSYTITNGTKVNIYDASGSKDQKWVIKNPNSQSEQYITNVYKQDYGLNARRTATDWPCTMYQTSGNNDGYVIIKETSKGSGLYTIQLSKHDNKYLTAASNSNSAGVSWTSKTGATNQTWKIVVLPEPKKVSGQYIHTGTNGWLKLYKTPTGSNGRTVKIPTVSKFTGSDGYTYDFKNKNYWYAYESASNFNGSATGITGAPPTKKKGSQGELTDEYGNYWVAVGPKVVNPSHASNAEPTPGEMYGRGKLDFVVKDSNNVKYYIPAVVGDTKNHTWSNGVIQTYKSYPNGVLESARGNFNGTVCAEFIGDLKNKLTGLGSYSIDSIIFYEH